MPLVRRPRLHPCRVTSAAAWSAPWPAVTGLPPTPRCTESVVHKLHEEAVVVALDDDDMVNYTPQIVVQFHRTEQVIKVLDNGVGGNQKKLEGWARTGASHNAKSRETDKWCARTPTPAVSRLAPRTPDEQRLDGSSLPLAGLRSSASSRPTSRSTARAPRRAAPR